MQSAQSAKHREPTMRLGKLTLSRAAILPCLPSAQASHPNNIHQWMCGAGACASEQCHRVETRRTLMNRRQFLESAACTSALSALPKATLAQSTSALAAPHIQKAWEKPEFEVRGLEIHSRRMWDWKSVSTAFSLIDRKSTRLNYSHLGI